MRRAFIAILACAAAPSMARAQPDVPAESAHELAELTGNVAVGDDPGVRHVQRAASVRTTELHHPWVAIDKRTNTIDDQREDGVRGTDFDIMRDYLQQMNDSIRHHADAWNIGVAPAHSAINGPLGTDDPVALGYVAPDGAALTTKGQEQIALALRRLGYAPTPEPFTLDGR